MLGYCPTRSSRIPNKNCACAAIYTIMDAIYLRGTHSLKGESARTVIGALALQGIERWIGTLHALRPGRFGDSTASTDRS